LINGRPYELVPIDAGLERAGTVKVVIHVRTGPLFHFAEPSARTVSGEPVDLQNYGIIPGEVARSELVITASRKLVSAWRDRGYAFARVTDQNLEANHNTGLLEVNMTLDPGIQAVFGDVTVVGAKTIEPDFIIQQADIRRGTVFSPKVLADASKRLRGLGVFSSVVIEEAAKPDSDGSIPVTITVAERLPKSFGVSLTAATQDGLGASAFWMHRNLFGRAESLRFEAEASGVGRSNLDVNLDYRVAAIFAKPGALGPTTTFRAKVQGEILDNDAYFKKGVSGNLELENEINDRMSIKAGLNVEYAEFTDTANPTTSLLVSTPLEFVYDARDNELNPTSGYRFSLEGEPAYDFLNSSSFFKAKAVFSTYYAVNRAKTFVLAGRVAAGTIVGAGLDEVPPDRLFYAGGGGSIRGYAYQAASPRDAQGQIEGGLSLLEASLEARIGITENIGMALFVDTGGAFSSSTPGEGGDWYTGVGAGLRYNTPVGPLRVDFAIPLKKIQGEPEYGIYLGLGQAF
jgi:translocation and assembly module TamA